MSHFKVKSINSRNLDCIQIHGADSNIYPLIWYKASYKSDDKVRAITKFIRDLDSGELKLYNNTTNKKYIIALEKTRKELHKYSSLEYGFYSLPIEGEEFKEITKVYLKNLGRKEYKLIS